MLQRNFVFFCESRGDHLSILFVPARRFDSCGDTLFMKRLCPPAPFLRSMTFALFRALSRCYIQRLMRGVGALFMFSSLVRAIRITAFCKGLPSCPSSPTTSKLSMSSSSRVLLDRVAGDGLGGSGTTLVPKVVAAFLHSVCNCLGVSRVCARLLAVENAKHTLHGTNEC